VKETAAVRGLKKLGKRKEKKLKKKNPPADLSSSGSLGVSSDYPLAGPRFVVYWGRERGGVRCGEPRGPIPRLGSQGAGWCSWYHRRSFVKQKEEKKRGREARKKTAFQEVFTTEIKKQSVWPGNGAKVLLKRGRKKNMSTKKVLGGIQRNLP